MMNYCSYHFKNSQKMSLNCLYPPRMQNMINYEELDWLHNDTIITTIIIITGNNNNDNSIIIINTSNNNNETFIIVIITREHNLKQNNLQETARQRSM